MLSEEVNERTVNFAVQTTKTSARDIARVLEKLIAEWKKADLEMQNPSSPNHGKTAIRRGRTSLKELSAKNDGLSTIELNNPNFRLLSRTMNKHGVDFAVTKDGKGKYTLFFKGKDVDSVTHAFSQYSKGMLQKGMGKSSVKVRLANARVKSEALSADRNKEKNRSRGGLER